MKTPLLEGRTTSSTNGASYSSSVLNLSTTIVGSGIMSIPATLKILGVGPAFFLILLVAFLCNTSAQFMLRYTAYGVSSTYAELMAESFGSMGSYALQLCVMFSNFGGLVMYLMIVGDVISGNKSEGGSAGLLVEWFEQECWWNSREFSLLLTLLLVLLPLVLLKKIDSLKYTSAISILLAVVFVLLSSAMALYALFNGTATAPKLLPNFAERSFFELFTAVPVIVVAFAFHYNVHPIRAELEQASDMKTAVRISLVLCSIIYAMVGLFNYLLFGDATMSDILSNFEQGGISSSFGPLLNDMVRISYVLHLILVFPLLNFSLRLNVDEMLFSKRKPLAADNKRFVMMTVILMAFVYLAAIAIPNIWVLFQFIGSTTAVCMSLIFPGAIVLRDVHGISKGKDKMQAGSMIAMAVFASTVAMASNISTYFVSSKYKSSWIERCILFWLF